MQEAEQERAKLQEELESNILYARLGRAQTARDATVVKLERVKKQRNDACERLAKSSAETTALLCSLIEAQLEVDVAMEKLRQVSTLLGGLSSAVRDESDMELPPFRIGSAKKKKAGDRVKGKGKGKQDELEGEEEYNVIMISSD